MGSAQPLSDYYGSNNHSPPLVRSCSSDDDEDTIFLNQIGMLRISEVMQQQHQQNNSSTTTIVNGHNGGPHPHFNSSTNGDINNFLGFDAPNEVNCVKHALPSNSWCDHCNFAICRICQQDHPGHTLIQMNLKRENLRSEAQTRLHKMSQMINEIYRNEGKKQDLVMKFIEALNVAKRDLEEDLLSNNFNELDEINDEIAHARRILNGTNVQGLNGLIGNLSYKQKQLEQILFKTVAFPLQNICHSTPTDVLKLIHSYACAKLGPSLIGNCQQNVLPPAMKKSLGTLINTNGVIHHQSIGPRYYFDMEMNGIAMGRIIIETRPDVAPKMCENFRCLASSEKGYGYKGCVVFQCWKGESVILGDFEHQNGRGGHSIYEDEPLFMPEDTRLAAMRGAIGMRRTQKRHDSKGLVGSQFRIILQEMPGFTGIFGRVLEGIEIVDKISECGDPSGNPTKRIVIKSCGILKSCGA